MRFPRELVEYVTPDTKLLSVPQAGSLFTIAQDNPVKMADSTLVTRALASVLATVSHNAWFGQ